PKCTRHVTLSPARLRSHSGPPRWVQRSLTAKYLSLTLARRISLPFRTSRRIVLSSRSATVQICTRGIYLACLWRGSCFDGRRWGGVSRVDALVDVVLHHMSAQEDGYLLHALKFLGHDSYIAPYVLREYW